MSSQWTRGEWFGNFRNLSQIGIKIANCWLAMLRITETRLKVLNLKNNKHYNDSK